MAAVSVEVKRIGKTYGSFTLEPVSFRATPGRIFGIFGPNASGKSTVLSVLCGLTLQDSGDVTINSAETDIVSDTPQVAAALDDVGFVPSVTVLEHLRAVARRFKINPSQISDVAGDTGIHEYLLAKIKSLSLGMRQRLSIAEVLLIDPPVMIFDEPTNGLDPGGIIWFRELLREQADLGKTLVITSHILQEAAKVTDDCLFLDNGRTLYSGNVSALQELAKLSLVSIASPNIAQLEQECEEARIPVIKQDSNTFVISKNKNAVLESLHSALDYSVMPLQTTNILDFEFLYNWLLLYPQSTEIGNVE